MIKNPASGTRIAKVEDAEAGVRVDQWLRRQVPQLTRSQLAALFTSRKILRNGRVTQKGDAVNVGDTIEFPVPEHWGATPDHDLELDVLLETPQLVVVNKPAGVPSAPLSPEQRGCLANALIARYPEMANVGYRSLEPGLVHRLDNDTSGLLLAARSAPAFDELRVGLQRGALSKRYLAVTHMLPLVGFVPLSDRGTLKHFVGPDPTHARRVRALDAAAPGLRPAECEYRVIRRGAEYLLLELAARAAYRHQLRAQLAAVGFPLVGDPLYGGSLRVGLSRHALHASQLLWPGGTTCEPFHVEAPLPSELAKLL